MTRTSLLLLCLSTSLIFGSAELQAQPPRGATPSQVFRVDSLSPDVVFKNGFQNNGYAFNVLDHALGRNCDATTPLLRSAWISTTSDQAQAEQFMRRQFEHSQTTPVAGAPAQAWLYTIRTDHSFLHVESIVQQAIQEGLRNMGGYSPAHSHVLQHLLANSNIHERNEVVTERIEHNRIESARRLTITRTAAGAEQLVWAETVSNAAFQAPSSTERMDNEVADLHDLVPPASHDFAGFAHHTLSAEGCFQTCDATASQRRQKRSVAETPLDYCPTGPSPAQALIGSED